MRQSVVFVVLLLIVFTAVAQPKRRGRVKRKYRNVERVNENLPQVIFRGLVRDANKIPLPGASVEIEGLKRRVHTNTYGEFMLSDLTTGRLRIKVACIGYRTKTIDYVFQPGFNDHYIALDRDRVTLEPLIVTFQKLEQQIPDIPTAISAATGSFFEQLSITGFSGIAALFPELSYEYQGAGHAGFSIRGATGSSGFPGVSPAVAVFADQVPVEQPGGFSALFFDMERLEVQNGSQNTLWGRNASSGAVHFISKKPEERFAGYITSGAGQFGKKEIRAAVNLPVAEGVLMVRAAGIYSQQDGFLENTFGGTLQGENVWGGRFSVRFIPTWNHKMDLQLNYRQGNEPGTAFLNRWSSNEDGETGLFNSRASLDQGEALGSAREMMDVAFTYRYFRNEHNYWTSISSFRRNNSDATWDADGSALPAIGMHEEAGKVLLFQEIRYNFSRKSRLTGSFGLNYNHESGDGSMIIQSNDQFIFELLSDSGNFVMPGESRFPVQPHPLHSGPMEGVLLNGDHTEEVITKEGRRSAEAWLHFTHQWGQRLFFTGGVRAVFDRLLLSQEAIFTGGEASSLGQFTGTAPNLLFSPASMQQLKHNNLAFAGQAGFTYRWNEKFNVFVNAIRGSRPPVLQFTWNSIPQKLDAEIVNSLEAGWKAVILQQIYVDVTGFYRQHSNLHTLSGTVGSGNALLADNGKATSYGAETGLKVAVIPGLDVFGNHAWLQSAFDSVAVNGEDYLYAGNRFARAPEHRFSAGFTGKLNISRTMRIFATPWYSWQSHFWFTEANTPGLAQPAYGILNINFGLEMSDPDLVLSIYGTNLLEEKYIASAGHWGGQFGMPTFVPGPPRMLGAKITWKF